MRELKNVLSLFDGHSGMQISLVDSGIEFENYYASEIDKHAIKVTQHNFPNTIQLGSVVDIDVSKLPKIDLISGGSPCQSFSFAGKRKGMSTTCNEEITTLEKYLQLKSEGFEFEGQSYLFWEFMRILTEVRKTNPDVLFLLENVEMGKKWESVLSYALGIFGVHINSTLVSAQNRKRIYWTNIRTKSEGLFGELHTDIPQPEDRKIFLKDVLESNVDEKYYLSDKMVDTLTNHTKFNKFECKEVDEKASTVLARCHKMGPADNYIKIDKQGNVKSNQEKASCFTAGGNSGGNHSDMDLFIVAQRGRNPDNPKSRVAVLPTEQMLEPRKDGKTNCLTSVQKDNYVMQLNPSKESGGNQPYQQNRVYDINGKMTCLDLDHRKNILVPDNSLMQIGYVGKENSQANRVYDVNGKSVCLQGEAGGGGAKTGLYLEIPEATTKGFTEIYPGDCFDMENPKSKTRRGRKMAEKTNCLITQSQNNFLHFTPEYRIRRLTPEECKRLQTVPNWFNASVVSDTQQYRMYGNGWNIETIKHILSYGNFTKRH